MDEDTELNLINARKLAEMRRKAELTSQKAAADAAPKPTKSSREVLEGVLYDRGDEVLEAAYQSYPKQTAVLVDQMAGVLKRNGMTERISGGELYGLFRRLGLRFALKTTIKVQEKGKFVDLKDKLKMDIGEG